MFDVIAFHLWTLKNYTKKTIMQLIVPMNSKNSGFFGYQLCKKVNAMLYKNLVNFYSVITSKTG